MKRIFTLIACAMLISCEKEMELPEPSVREEKSYTLSVTADKGGGLDTNALTFSGVSSELMAVWAVGGGRK